MNKVLGKKVLLTCTVASLFTLYMLGCTKAEEYAALGAGIGALAGQAIGGDTGATLIGAGAGALIGNSMSDDD